jgi:fructose-bisphosphate aldolase, class I
MGTDGEALLGNEAEFLWTPRCATIARDSLHRSRADFIDRIVAGRDLGPATMRSLQQIFDTGRRAGPG